MSLKEQFGKAVEQVVAFQDEHRSKLAVVGLQCHWCSKWFTAAEIIKIGESMQRCLKCEQAHREALNKLAAHPPQECGTCKATWEQLKERTHDEHVRMYIHWKDGCYQMLCKGCDALYVPKRVDLYGPTRFGWERKLK